MYIVNHCTVKVNIPRTPPRDVCYIFISQNLAKKILPSLVKIFNPFSNLGRCQVFVGKIITYL